MLFYFFYLYQFNIQKFLKFHFFMVKIFSGDRLHDLKTVGPKSEKKRKKLVKPVKT